MQLSEPDENSESDKVINSFDLMGINIENLSGNTSESENEINEPSDRNEEMNDAERDDEEMDGTAHRNSNMSTEVQDNNDEMQLLEFMKIMES